MNSKKDLEKFKENFKYHKNLEYFKGTFNSAL